MNKSYNLSDYLYELLLSSLSVIEGRNRKSTELSPMMVMSLPNMLINPHA